MENRLFVFLMVIISIILPANAVESSKYYGGVDVFSSDLSFERKLESGKTVTKDVRSKGARLIGGIKFDRGIRVQFFLSIENMNNKIFSSNNDSSYDDGTWVALGSDLIKTFEMTERFKPFILISLGQSMKFDALTLKSGLGVLYAFNEIFELKAGVNYKYRIWSDIKVPRKGQNDYLMSTFDRSITPYLGLNFHF